MILQQRAQCRQIHSCLAVAFSVEQSETMRATPRVNKTGVRHVMQIHISSNVATVTVQKGNAGCVLAGEGIGRWTEMDCIALFATADNALRLTWTYC